MSASPLSTKALFSTAESTNIVCVPISTVFKTLSAKYPMIPFIYGTLIPILVVLKSIPSNLSTLLPDCMPNLFIVSKSVSVERIATTHSPLCSTRSCEKFRLFTVMLKVSGTDVCCKNVFIMHPLSSLPAFAQRTNKPYEILNNKFICVLLVLILIF